MIKVLIVDDSPTIRQLLEHILSSDPEIQIIGMVEDGLKAVQFVSTNRPDVITMDINMPFMDGISATRQIMETNPVPIVIVSSLFNSENLKESFRALEAGAVATVEMPHGSQAGISDLSHAKLLQTVRLMSEVRLVQRRPKKPGNRIASDKGNLFPFPKKSKEHAPQISTFVSSFPKTKIVAIGASTGGPPVIQTIFSFLPKEFLAPILVVQHISHGFLTGMIEWLKDVTGLHVQIAIQGELLRPGRIYFAPDGAHMGVLGNRMISLSGGPPINGVRPSISHLFKSIAETFGPNSIGVLLSGMGRDGSTELKLMRDQGALTIAQDKESSIIFGMPGEAVKIDAATHVLAPHAIGQMLAKLMV